MKLWESYCEICQIFSNNLCPTEFSTRQMSEQEKTVRTFDGWRHSSHFISVWLLNIHIFMTRLIKLNNITIPLKGMLGPFKVDHLNASKESLWEVWEMSAWWKWHWSLVFVNRNLKDILCFRNVQNSNVHVGRKIKNEINDVLVIIYNYNYSI